MSLRTLAPLRHRDFRLLWSGQVVSDLGDWLDFIALVALIAYGWNVGAAGLAALSMAIALPRVVVGPAAGVWADRWTPRTVMLVADLSRAVTALGLVYAPDLRSLLTLVVVKAVFSAVFAPARQAMIRSVTPDGELLAASSLSHLSSQSAKVVGPVLGGLLVGAFGARVPFAIDAGTFIASAALLARLPTTAIGTRPPERGREWSPRHALLAEISAGLGYLVRHPPLALAVGSMCGTLCMVFLVDSLGVLALKELGVGQKLFGLAVGSVGLGTVLGVLLVGQWGDRTHPLALMGAGQALIGGMVGLLGTATILGTGGTGLQWVPVYLVIGLAAAAISVPYGYLLQVEVPRELVGRVFGAADGLATMFQLLAPLLGAVLVGRWGVGGVFTAAGAALFLIGLSTCLLRPRPTAGPAGIVAAGRRP